MTNKQILLLISSIVFFGILVITPIIVNHEMNKAKAEKAKQEELLKSNTQNKVENNELNKTKSEERKIESTNEKNESTEKKIEINIYSIFYGFLGIIMLIFFLILIFLPIVFATIRNHPNQMAICLLTVICCLIIFGCILNWPLLVVYKPYPTLPFTGWIVALVWALTHIEPKISKVFVVNKS